MTALQIPTRSAAPFPAAPQAMVVRPASPTLGRHAPEVYRRRRLVVGALLSAVVLLGSTVAGRAGAEQTDPLPSDTEAVTVVVRSGDTLWGIAGRIAPDADRRATVDRLAEAAGGADLAIGQRFVVELPR